MFKGLSSLRAGEKKEVPQSEKAKAMQAYLAAQYGGGEGGKGEKKKKKKKRREVAGGPGIKILDQDVSGFAAAPAADRRAAPLGGGGDDDDDDEDQPVVANPEEAERLKRLAEKEKQFFSKGMDGSGWVEGGGGGPQDASPPRRGRHDSPDASPPRRRAAAADASPPRRGRHDSPDASPPRRRAAAADASPPRRGRHDSPDASPPRRRAAAVDASPPRRGRHDSPDASPPPRQRRDSPDASPPRRGAAADALPPRKRQADDGNVDGSDEAEAKRRKMMSDGTVAGMVSGRELMEEMKRKRERERRRFAELGADVTGRDAQTVFRDKEGRAVSKEEFLEAQAAAKKKAQYDAEAALEWGGGLKQRVEAQAAAAAMAAEAAKPFARSADDAELDAMHRSRTRWGDPMAGLVKPKEPELPAPVSLAARHLSKKAGFIIPTDVPKHSWLRRGVGPPPNRYGIKPGRHWDGVDRGNGFEREMFKRQTELKRREQEAWQWAQEDM